MARLANITFAARDPGALAAFWAEALAYVVQPPPPELLPLIERGEFDANEAAAIVDPEGRNTRLYFERKEPSRPGTAPVHLDISARDPEAEVVRLTALGASLVEWRSRTIGEETFRWAFMRDPEGNGFCVE